MAAKHWSAWPLSYSVSRSWLRIKGENPGQGGPGNDDRDLGQDNGGRGRKKADSSLLFEAEL